MTIDDSRGLPTTTTSARALAHYETALDRAHSYFGDPFAALDLALAEDPAFPMAHALRAGLLAMSTEKAAAPALRAALAAAEPLVVRATDRERGHLAAAHAWADGDLDGAVRRWGAISVLYPRDTLALQLAHLGDFYLGQSTLLRDRVARVLPAWSDDVPGFGYVLGMHAFGLEETGDHARAVDTGRRALALNARDPWAVHAVAHVHEMRAQPREGARWLRERERDWAPDNAFAFHNYWHLCLFHLDLGETDEVLAPYDAHVRRASGVVLEMVDASALLWRLRLRGVDVGPRWRELGAAWAPTATDAFYAFNDAHALMAFLGAGREAEARALLAAVEQRASGTDTNSRLTREVGLPVCRALAAFEAGDYERTIELLTDVLPRAHRFGGSHAQRDVLSLTLLEAALRGGFGALARALAAERTALRPTSPAAWTLTERALRLGGAAAA
jgi:hypothetical protein